MNFLEEKLKKNETEVFSLKRELQEELELKVNTLKNTLIHLMIILNTK